MGIITHGSILPDSAGKSDFYGIVDNATVSGIIDADISAGAAIQDIKLAQIQTAGKVNVTALTGNIGNALLNQIVQAGLVSGSSLVNLPNIPSGAGLIPVANIAPTLPISILDYGTSTSVSTQRGVAATAGLGILQICYGHCADDSAISNLPYATSTSYVVVGIAVSGTVSQNVSLKSVSNSGFTIGDGLGNGNTIMWVAIGT